MAKDDDMLKLILGEVKDSKKKTEKVQTSITNLTKSFELHVAEQKHVDKEQNRRLTEYNESLSKHIRGVEGNRQSITALQEIAEVHKDLIDNPGKILGKQAWKLLITLGFGAGATIAILKVLKALGWLTFL